MYINYTYCKTNKIKRYTQSHNEISQKSNDMLLQFLLYKKYLKFFCTEISPTFFCIFCLPFVNCSLQALAYSANLAYRSRFDLFPSGRGTWFRNAQIDLAQGWWHTPSFDSPHGILPVTGLTARNCSLVWFSHSIQHSPSPRLPSRQECISSLLYRSAML